MRRSATRLQEEVGVTQNLARVRNCTLGNVENIEKRGLAPKVENVD